MEHGGVGIDTLKAQFAFARGTGIAPLVRVPGLAYHLIAPVLDAGAMGIMVPMLETSEQAEKLAAWCRYRPKGVRGLGFGVGHDDYTGGDVVAKMIDENERTLVDRADRDGDRHRQCRRHPGRRGDRCRLARPLRPHGFHGHHRAVR